MTMDALIHFSPELFFFLCLFLSLLLLAQLPPAEAAVSTIVVTATVPTSSSTSTPSYTLDDQFQRDVLNSTNVYRSQHNATALAWNSSLASSASSWAQGCQWAHSGGLAGENLASNYMNTSAAIAAWAAEREVYSFQHPGFSETTGHFTQLVWKATTSVGCGRMACDGRNGMQGWFVVCEYWPAGNVAGGFEENVDRQEQGPEQGGRGDEGGIGGEKPGLGVAGRKEVQMWQLVVYAVIVVGLRVLWW
ncbi:CAP domain-containing protein [Cryomyces antarcticus]